MVDSIYFGALPHNGVFCSWRKIIALFKLPGELRLMSMVGHLNNRAAASALCCVSRAAGALHGRSSAFSVSSSLLLSALISPSSHRRYAGALRSGALRQTGWGQAGHLTALLRASGNIHTRCTTPLHPHTHTPHCAHPAHTHAAYPAHHTYPAAMLPPYLHVHATAATRRWDNKKARHALLLLPRIRLACTHAWHLPLH